MGETLIHGEWQAVLGGLQQAVLGGLQIGRRGGAGCSRSRLGADEQYNGERRQGEERDGGAQPWVGSNTSWVPKAGVPVVFVTSVFTGIGV